LLFLFSPVREASVCLIILTGVPFPAGTTIFALRLFVVSVIGVGLMGLGEGVDVERGDPGGDSEEIEEEGTDKEEDEEELEEDKEAVENGEEVDIELFESVVDTDEIGPFVNGFSILFLFSADNSGDIAPFDELNIEDTVLVSLEISG